MSKIRKIELDPRDIRDHEGLDAEVKLALLSGKAVVYEYVQSGRPFVLIEGGQ